MAQISPKLFSTELQRQIFPDNVFYTKGRKDIAAGDKDSVDIPIAGNLGEAKIGQPNLPVTIGSRTDDVLNYPLTQIYAEPILVKREEDIVLNYNKLEDIARGMGEAISTKCADYTAQAWGATSSGILIGTSGSARATSLVGATGNRKAIAKADILKIRNAILKTGLSQNGWIGVITPDQHDDLLNIADFVDYEKTGVESKLKEGFIGRLLGIDFMVRWNATYGSIGLHYTANGAAKKAISDAIAATDTAAALFFHPNHVRYAEAFPDTIINRKVAGYLGGTIIESVLRFGATKSRKDEKGVITLFETTTT